MSLAEKVAGDNRRVFQNLEQFASKHTWNGAPFVCVTDEIDANKRKNNNVVDISWDNSTSEVTIYVAEGDFPGRAQPQEHGFFDRKPMRMVQVHKDMGMLTIVLATYESKAVRV